MRYKLRDEIMSSRKHTYVAGDMSVPAGMVDCSAGFNPYGMPKAASAALARFNPDTAIEYPHGAELDEAIIKFWSGYTHLQKSNIILTNGSIGGIYLVNCAFSRPNASVLAFAPHFSDYSEHARFMGIKYTGIRLTPEDDYRVDINKLLKKTDDKLSLIYIDNPNNPTGQAIAPAHMREILDKAKAHGVCVLADEAYGDYMEASMSSATLLNDYDNLIVLRTFSKGMGLAGLRAGYLLSCKKMCDMLMNICNPYNISAPAREAAVAALADTGFICRCRESIAKSKALLREALGKNLQMAHTLDTCPIALLTHKDQGTDLAAEFKKRNIMTYSGADFDGLSKNSVRLRIPHESECAAVFRAVSEIG